nr:MAG TPA_asm: hypothetical protein [Caudoviricetes sp.]
MVSKALIYKGWIVRHVGKRQVRHIRQVRHE